MRGRLARRGRAALPRGRRRAGRARGPRGRDPRVAGARGITRRLRAARLGDRGHGRRRPNNDGRPDHAFVLHQADPRNVLDNRGKLGSERLDSNPRVLAVALARPDGGYALALQDAALIPRHESPTMDDPFGGPLDQARHAAGGAPLLGQRGRLGDVRIAFHLPAPERVLPADRLRPQEHPSGERRDDRHQRQPVRGGSRSAPATSRTTRPHCGVARSRPVRRRASPRSATARCSTSARRRPRRADARTRARPREGLEDGPGPNARERGHPEPAGSRAEGARRGGRRSVHRRSHGPSRLGGLTSVARRQADPASASSTSSTQCRTGVAVPLCRCWMQPTLADDDDLRLGARRDGRACGRAAGRHLGLQHRVGAGRAAAEVALVRRQAHVEAELGEAGLDAAAHALAVLQRAGRVERDAGAPRAPAASAPSAGTRSGSSSLRSRVSSAMRSAPCRRRPDRRASRRP